MQQYLDMKSENPDAVLMFRLGDFYEVFFNDARIVSKALDLVLTHRGTDERGSDIPMCGIPWHASDNYLGRLVRAGINVALAEQMESPEEARARGHKQIERKIVRVLTAGTLTDENLLTPKKSNFLVAVIMKEEGQKDKRTNGQEQSEMSICPSDHLSFSFAGCDISTGEFFIGESENICDDMARIGPAEIIFPEISAELPEMQKLRASFKTTPVYEKSYMREDIGQIVFKVFGIKEQGSGTGTRDFGLAPAPDPCSYNAIALLAAYLNNTQRGAAIAFRTPYQFGAGRQLLIDAASWKSLEIDAPLNDGGLCLLDILDKTRTAAGARKLRAYLRMLSGDLGEIRRRNEHIGHLVLNSEVSNAMAAAMSGIPDVGRSLGRLMSGRGVPRDLRSVADFMVSLPKIKSIGAKLDSDLAARFADINTHDNFAGELKFALADELPSFFRDGGIIRDGFDGALDNMKKMSLGAKETIAALQNEYITSTGINTLKIKYNNILGYHIEVPSARADILMKPDSGFIHRQTMAGNMRFTTPRLIDLDNDVRGAGDKALAIESEIVASLISKVRVISDDLLATAELLADADVWLGLSDCAQEYDWVRPNMTNGRDFEIRGGRHPVIENVLRKSGNQFVKNDCELNNNQIALLTGPNMAGKSTYLRQNAMIVVLAHLGSFVPAESASIGICDQLFSRVGASDNLAAGQSTFMVEMSETANILNRATDKSFIIFDEIGRGTATWDGMAIAQAVLEFLDNMQPRTLFATHYHELTELKFDSIKNLTVAVQEYNNEIIFMHKIVPGAATSSYGIFVAKMAGMPASVIEAAQRILDGLESGAGQKAEVKSQLPEIAKETPIKVSDAVQNKTQLLLFGD
jgi:DNA mismatch repair protein MutS